MKPIIAITPTTDGKRFLLNKAYCDAVKAAGGLPIALPYLNPLTDESSIKQTLALVDGVVLSGGGDIHSAYFDEPLHPKADCVFPERDHYEMCLCKMALEADKPMLCICRGMQLLNVSLGGGVNQHIEGHNHEGKRTEPVHKITIVSGSVLHEMLQTTEMSVNSIHHQCVSWIGRGVLVTATSSDGVVEAITLPEKKFVHGVQWHPEALFTTYPENLALFQGLVHNTALS